MPRPFALPADYDLHHGSTPYCPAPIQRGSVRLGHYPVSGPRTTPRQQVQAIIYSETDVSS